MAFQGRLTGWRRMEGWRWRPDEGQWPRRRTPAHRPVAASPASCGRVGGCGRRRKHLTCRGSWSQCRRGGPGSAGARAVPPTRLATRAGPLGAAPPRFPRQPRGNKQGGACNPPPAGNETRLPPPAPGAGAHCVPGGAGPVFPEAIPAPHPRAAKRASTHRGAAAAPGPGRGRAAYHVSSAHSFHCWLPREGPSCALSSSPRGRGQEFPIQHRSAGGQAALRKSGVSPKCPPPGSQAWR